MRTRLGWYFSIDIDYQLSLYEYTYCTYCVFCYLLTKATYVGSYVIEYSIKYGRVIWLLNFVAKIPSHPSC